MFVLFIDPKVICLMEAGGKALETSFFMTLSTLKNWEKNNKTIYSPSCPSKPL